MKKIKSLKTLTTLGAISAITPIITTACNDKDSQPTPVDKIDINSFDWSNTGNYNSAMTTIQFIDEFKKNNVAGQNNIPADIYDHINFDISGALASWTITLTAKDTSTKYFGTKQIDINAKINVVSLNWISTGDYSIDMAKDHILNVFKQNNPSGQHGLPDDVYENVDVTNDGESKWTISITAKDTSTTYIGQDNISISASGSITYDGKKYILADNLDINCFCGTGGLTIPTKDNGNLIVDFHSKITEIIFPPNITTKHINDFFLFNFDNLKSIDLSNLNSVTSIGNRFMFSCGSLEEVNLDGLYNVKEIGFSFMYGCSGLRTFDTKNLSNVENIGDYFLAYCDGLAGSLDFSSMTNLKTIGKEFLRYCDNIQQVKLNNLPNLTSIGDNFLSDNNKMNKVDLSNDPNLTTIGNNFMNQCPNFVDLNLRSVKNLKNIGDCFLNDCSILPKLDLSEAENIEHIGAYFLTNCDNLRTIHLGNTKANAFVIDNYSFTISSKSLTTYTKGVLITGKDSLNITTKFPNDYSSSPKFVRNIYSEYDNTMTFQDQSFTLKENIDPNKFLTYDSGAFSGATIQYIPLKNNTTQKINGTEHHNQWYDLTALKILSFDPNVNSIGNYFLYMCNELTSITFKNCKTITSLGNHFMENTSKLGSFDFNEFTNVETIGEYFLYKFSAIDTIDMSKMVSLKSIGKYFISYVLDLEALYVPLIDPNTYSVSSDNFMSDVPKDCKIHAGEFAAQYRKTSPWSKRSSQIVE